MRIVISVAAIFCAAEVSDADNESPEFWALDDIAPSLAKILFC